MYVRRTNTLLAALLPLCVSCHPAEAPEAQQASVEPAVDSAPTTSPTAPLAQAGKIRGTVVETMDSGGYTYVLVSTGSAQAWAAGPMVAVAVGDRVAFDSSMLMTNYFSGSLDRTFERIYFTGAIERDAAQQPAASAAAGTVATAKAEGGVTVEEVFARSDDLVGTEVAIRGEVVKYNAGILGKNWLHIRDGTGAEGTNDLTITTAATAAVGDTVLVRGVLAADRDFGAGYIYPLIVEDAQVSVE